MTGTPQAIQWTIPRTGGLPELELSLGAGEALFVVGANGSGKSALLQHLATKAPQERTRWITAHRQNWFSSGAVELTPKARRAMEQSAASNRNRPDSRWIDRESGQRLSAVLFDLVAEENERARRVTEHVDQGDLQAAHARATESDSAFKSLNRLLALGTLTVSLRNSKGEEILASHPNCEAFSLAKLLDGERNAVIIAANVLTVPAGTLLMIDEPERHLHRSIVEPFLSALVAQRPDCSFIVATHELALPASLPEARVLMPRACHWQGDTPREWELQVLDPEAGLPEELRVAVLGARRQILFVEGQFESLDLPLYNALFPALSVIPRDGCGDVVRAVQGLRGAADHHHVEAFGLIDRDDRTDEQVLDLESKFIFALDVHSAESLYYSVASIDEVARRQAAARGIDPEPLRASAVSGALEAVAESSTQERLAARRCESRIRAALSGQFPDWKAIRDAAGQDVAISASSPWLAEREQIRNLVSLGDWDGVISRYPVRETTALDKIARALKCSSRNDYEQLVVAAVHDGPPLRGQLRDKLGELPAALSTGSPPDAPPPESANE